MAYVLVSLGRCRVCTGLLALIVVAPLLVFLYTLRGYMGVRMLFNATGAGAAPQLVLETLLERPLRLESPLVRSYADLVLLLVFLAAGFYAVFGLGGGVEKGYVFLDMVAAGGRLRGLARIMLYMASVLVPALGASGLTLLLVLRVYLGVVGDAAAAFWGALRAGIAGLLAGTALALHVGDRGLAILSLLALIVLLVVLDSLAGFAANERFFTALFSLPSETSPLAYPLLAGILVLLCVVGVMRLEARG